MVDVLGAVRVLAGIYLVAEALDEWPLTLKGEAEEVGDLEVAEAQAGGLVTNNAVTDWKALRRGKGRRRSVPGRKVTRDMVLTADELAMLLAIAKRNYSKQYPFILFMADTGARIGEASALRWSD